MWMIPSCPTSSDSCLMPATLPSLIPRSRLAPRPGLPSCSCACLHLPCLVPSLLSFPLKYDPSSASSGQVMRSRNISKTFKSEKQILKYHSLYPSELLWLHERIIGNNLFSVSTLLFSGIQSHVNKCNRAIMNQNLTDLQEIQTMQVSDAAL